MDQMTPTLRYFMDTRSPKYLSFVYLSVLLYMWLFICDVIHLIVCHISFSRDQNTMHILLHSWITIMHIVHSLLHWHGSCFQMICIICLYLCLQQTIPPPQAAQTQPAIMQPSNEPPPYTESSAQRVNTDDLQKRQEVNY